MRRQASHDLFISFVFGNLGQTSELERDGGSLWHKLGYDLSLDIIELVSRSRCDIQRHCISNGTVEGMNNKAKLAIKKAYGFKSYKTLETALDHQLGKLSEPETTQKSC